MELRKNKQTNDLFVIFLKTLILNSSNPTKVLDANGILDKNVALETTHHKYDEQLKFYEEKIQRDKDNEQALIDKIKFQFKDETQHINQRLFKEFCNAVLDEKLTKFIEQHPKLSAEMDALTIELTNSNLFKTFKENYAHLNSKLNTTNAKVNLFGREIERKWLEPYLLNDPELFRKVTANVIANYKYASSEALKIFEPSHPVVGRKELISSFKNHFNTLDNTLGLLQFKKKYDPRYFENLADSIIEVYTAPSSHRKSHP